MIEVRGWILFPHLVYDDNDSVVFSRSEAAKLTDRLRELASERIAIFDVHSQNGQYFIAVGDFSNHLEVALEALKDIEAEISYRNDYIKCHIIASVDEPKFKYELSIGDPLSP